MAEALYLLTPGLTAVSNFSARMTVGYRWEEPVGSRCRERTPGQGMIERGGQGWAKDLKQKG